MTCVTIWDADHVEWCLNSMSVMCQVRQWHCDDNPGTCPHPEQVTAGQQWSHPQACSFVLPNDVITSCTAWRKMYSINYLFSKSNPKMSFSFTKLCFLPMKSIFHLMKALYSIWHQWFCHHSFCFPSQKYMATHLPASLWQQKLHLLHINTHK